MRKTDKGAEAVRLYVSPDGNDAWSGRLPRPNARGSDGPLATPQAASKRVRALRGKQGLKRSVEILLRGGTYFLRGPLRLTPAESGARGADHPKKGDVPPRTVTFRAYRNEKPRLSGGRRISGFRETTINGRRAWVAALPAVRSGTWYFRELWVNGERRERPRLPREGFYRVAKRADGRPFSGNWNDGDDKMIYAKGDLDASWKNLQDVELHFFNAWIDPCVRIRRIDPRRRCVDFDRFMRANLRDDDERGGGACYVVDNVFEALTEPGQWYLDRPEGKLYYLPRRGERLRTAEVVAPRLTELVRVAGASEQRPVCHVGFEGLTFAHSHYPMPDGWSGSNQASWEVPGALVFRHAQRCGVRRCTVRNLGQYAIELPEGAWDCDCIGNTLTDLGAGGIKVWHGCRRTRITDNEITHGGRVFHSGIGVLVGQAIGTQVLHNHVMDFDYSAVSVGWTWGYQESHAYGNVVEHNHLQDIGHGRLSDMAAVYTLGVQPGTRVRFNLIHDVWSRTYGGWGLYTDEGSSYILLENNLCYNCKTGGFHQHYGRENVVRNNILALATTADLQRSRAEPHRSFLFESNIIYCTAGKVWGGWLGGFHPDNLTLRRNLYFAARRQRLDFSGMSWRQWRKLGLDEDSVLADPKFVNPAKGDFRFRKNSPYGKIGFIPFDLSSVGPRGERR